MNRDLYDKAERMLEKEIREIVDKGELSPSTLEVMGKALDDIKDISIICAMKEESEYSERYMYGDDMAYARRRDSRGRYARDSYDSYGQYDGYSRTDELEGMMRDAKTDKERELIRQLMDAKKHN